MKKRILILGAGFGGLELSTSLSETLGESVEITLIDKSDFFVFGFSKLDVMFGRAARPSACRIGRSRSQASASYNRPSRRSIPWPNV